MNLIAEAKKGNISPLIKEVAAAERVPEDAILQGLVEGTIVVPANGGRKRRKPCGIGKGLRVKVNANIGTSQQENHPARELKKLAVAETAGADTVMDLSTGGDISSLRRRILQNSSVPIGTVPIYEAAIRAGREKGKISAMTGDEMLGSLRNQARQGVDFMTVHCGVNLSTLQALRGDPRLLGVVSRGGAFLLEWMISHEEENPLYARFDEVLDICLKAEVTLSLGDGLRPGCIADATDRAQIQELVTLGELVSRCRKAGVQVMVEGPGHVPLDQIAENIRLEKELCGGAPFYVLGPLVSDVAPGYDHIICAIGGAVAAFHGADYLCYVTPSEHLGLPSEEDVREGVIATRIAAHVADLSRGNKEALAWDRLMSIYRRKRDWKGQIKTALSPDRAREYLGRSGPPEDYCSMCSEYCALKVLEQHLSREEQGDQEIRVTEEQVIREEQGGSGRSRE